MLSLIRPQHSVRDALRQAQQIAQQSPDPSTKNGAVIETKTGQTVTGFNALPGGVTPEKVYFDTHDMAANRAYRYPRTVHAEVAAVANAAREGIAVEGATMYMTGQPCSACAASIVNAGIRHIVFAEDHSQDFSQRWKDQMAIGMELFEASGVTVQAIRMNQSQQP